MPEQFWSLPHLVVYAGLAMVVCSSALNFLVMANRRQKNEKALLRWLAVISLGADLEFFSGYFDMRAHEINGLDAVVTPSHVGAARRHFYRQPGLLPCVFLYRNACVPEDGPSSHCDRFLFGGLDQL